jgi:hypothetical protein
MHSKDRKYGITVWKTDENHFLFKAEAMMDQLLIGELYSVKDGWEIKGGYSNGSIAFN